MLTAIGRAAACRLPIRAAPLIVSRPQPIARAACRSFSTTQWSRLAAKAATTKKTAKKTSTVKEKAKKATSPKKETKKTKKTEKTEKVKRGPKPKPLTAEQLEKVRKRAWKEQSLVASEPKSKARTGWTVFLDEFLQTRRPGMKVPSVLPEASAEYRQLPSYEIQRLEKKAEENKRAWQVEWKAWLTSYTPQEIVAANTARGHLRKLKGKQIPAHLKDERIPKQPTTAFAGFVKARLATGELPGRVNEHMKTLSGEWHALSEDEKAPWLEMAEAEKARYSRDVREVLGREVHK